MATSDQIPNSLLFDAGNLWQQEGHSPFGSLIELAFKLKTVHFRLLQKFGARPESCTRSSHIIFSSSSGFCHEHKDQPYVNGGQDNFLARSYKNLLDSSDSLASKSFCNIPSDFKLLPEPGKPKKSVVHYENDTDKKLLPIQQATKSFDTAPHCLGTANQSKLSSGNPSTRKSRRLQRFHEDLKRKHNCPLCLYQTDNRCHLQRHQSSVHNDDKPYYCYICKKEFSRSERVKAHFLNIHPETTYHSKMAKKELYMFEDQKDFDLEAVEFTESCNASQNQLVAVEAAQSTSDTNASPVKKSWERYCRIARQPFNNQEIFRCRICSFSGSDIWLMKKHYLDVHLGATTYVCRICRYSSSCMTRLVSHMLGHGELICFYCSYSTTEVKLFEKHLKDCSLLVRCSACGMSFVGKDLLQSHTIEAHQFVLFCCDQCSFSSNSYADLSLHESLHAVSNSSLVQEVESDDEILLGPYRSRSDVSNTSFPSQIFKQRLDTNVQVTSDDTVMNTNKDDISHQVLNSSDGALGSKDSSVTTSMNRLSSHVYECLVPNCGFKSSWKKSLELHTENYHSIFFDNFQVDRSVASCESKDATLPQPVDCPASGFFPCPFCPNYRTFKYRKSFEKHLAQHGLDHKKYPHLLAGLNLKGEALNAAAMGNQ